MLETPHVAVGIAIASKIPNPWLAIPLSLASHFILDKVPHWNPHLYTETQKLGRPSKKSTTLEIIDISAAFILGSTFAIKALPNWQMAVLILSASFTSVASDVVKYPYYYFPNFRPKWLVRWVKFERSMQVDAKSPFWGLLTQALVIFAALYTLSF